jgi:hypothetical protein
MKGIAARAPNLLIMGLIFWILSFWLIASTEGGSNIAFDIAFFIALMLNSYLIIRLTKEQFDDMTTVSLILFFSSISALKLIVAFESSNFDDHYQIMLFDPQHIFFVVTIILALDFFLILGILKLHSTNPLQLKTFVPYTLLLLTFGDVFCWFFSGFIWITFNMGGIAG